MSIAATFTASFTPSTVPLEIASNALVPNLFFDTDKSSLISSVSGSTIFAKTIAAGALISEAVNKCFAKNIFCSGSSPPKNPI